jgi:hypothetical protein
MKRIDFVDPFTVEARAPGATPARLAPAPAAPGVPSAALEKGLTGPTRGREHEVRRLIRDLEALASRNRPTGN